MSVVIENLTNFYVEWYGKNDKILDFLIRLKCLPEQKKCPHCRRMIPLNREKLFFRCRKSSCKDFRVSAKKGTFFDNAKLPIFQIVEFIVWFCEFRSPRQQTIMRNLKLSSNTVVDWESYCREVCMVYLEKNSTPLGGPNTIVEIDEAQIGKEKGQWVIGGIERGTNKIFMEPVENRDKDALLEIIQRRILPGTTVISNKWKAYDCLTDEGFNHFSVNNSVSFVDFAANSNFHTQNIKRSWRDVRGGIPRFGRKKEHFVGYLAEHLFKKKYDQDYTIEAFFRAIAEVYSI